MCNKNTQKYGSGSILYCSRLNKGCILKKLWSEQNMKVQTENGTNYSRKDMAVIKTFQQTKPDDGVWGKTELLSLLKQDLIDML